ncbi:hypothetical protein BJP25_20165 [Actinokineospora bangkokensis]|uniref:Uncharacterized protein n=1 Tax=Actinokineospora bangkokensis TaxID=1193682 RepID=A0A1Q9LK82_9PSEU|nr:hypothetical protein BJP25_20165 [Actinokineospora bangkokensis]
MDTSWLRGDPTEGLRPARPRTFKELVTADPLWRRIYQEWLAEHYDTVMPGFDHPQVQALFDRLTDTTRQRTPLDDAMQKPFEDAYRRKPDGFYEQFGAIKDMLRARTEAARAADRKLSERDALKAVGKQVAVEAVQAALADAAGDAPIALRAWTQVEAFKQEFTTARNKAVQEFAHPAWNKHSEHWQMAQDLLAERIGAVSSKEGVLRETVQQGQAMLGAGSKPPAVYLDKLTNDLVEWASAINLMAAGFAECANLMSQWAKVNAEKLMKDDFDTFFPITGGVMLAARTAIGVAGVVLGFFPQLAPIAGGLDLADQLVEGGVRRAVVAVASRNGKNKVDLAGVKLELTDEFKNSRAGKLYMKKEAAKEYAEGKLQQLGDTAAAFSAAVAKAAEDYVPGVKAAREAATRSAVAAQAGIDDLRRQILERKPELAKSEAFDGVMRRLTVLFGNRQEEATEAELSATAEEIKGLLSQAAELGGLEGGLPSLGGMVKDALGDAFTAMAPGLASAISTAMPVIGVVKVTVSTVLDGVEFWAAMNKGLTPDGMTTEQLAQFQAIVGRNVLGTHVAFEGLDFSSVKWVGKQGSALVVEVAGVQGTFDPATLRFSPFDRSGMQGQVLSQVRRSYSVGLHSPEGTVQLSWDGWEWGDELGEGTQSAAVPATHPDGRAYDLQLLVYPEGRLVVTGQTMTKAADPARLAKRGAVVIGTRGPGRAFDLINGIG